MADTKVSALIAVAAVAAANEFVVNEAGVSKKASAAQFNTYLQTLPLASAQITALPAASALAATNTVPVDQAGVAGEATMTQLAAFFQPKLISSAAAPAAGVANAGAAPSETWLLNTADNAVTTVETVMSLTGLDLGTYFVEYYIVWRSGTTTVGASFAVNFTGTVTRVRATRHMQTTGAAAATGVSDGVSAILTGTLVEHHSTMANNGALGPNTGVASITEDQYDHIRMTIVVSTTGDLNLTMTGEGNGGVTFRADSFAMLKRLA